MGAANDNMTEAGALMALRRLVATYQLMEGLEEGHMQDDMAAASSAARVDAMGRVLGWVATMERRFGQGAGARALGFIYPAMAAGLAADGVL